MNQSNSPSPKPTADRAAVFLSPTLPQRRSDERTLSRLPPSTGAFCARVWLVAAAVLAAPTSLSADTIWLLDQTEPLHGRVVDQNETRVVFQSLEAGQPERIIPADNLRFLHRTIDTQRLAALRPDQPEGYLRAAEELAAFPFDPSSRQLAIELAAVALHLETSGTRASSGSGARSAWHLLMELEPDPAARSRLQVFGLWNGWLATPDAGTGSGSTTSIAEAGADSAGQQPIPASPNELLEFIRRIRRGQLGATEAGETLPRMQSGLLPWQVWMTPAELADCVQNQDLLGSERTLRLLRLERELDLAIRREMTGPALPAPPRDWSVQARFPARPIPQLPDCRSLTHHDPELCYWRQGKWQQDP